MNIVLYTDETVEISLEPLVAGLNGISSGITFAAELGRAIIRGVQVSNPDSYRTIVFPNQPRYSIDDYIIVATTKPYDNNYFFEYSGKEIIVSFSGWEQLTTLPM